MKLIVSENWEAVFNSENFAKAEIVYDIMGDDKESNFGYALDAWTKDGSVYRLGMYETPGKAKSELTILMCELACCPEEIIIPSGNKLMWTVRDKVLK